MKPEILAPAGGEEQLTAAVRSGADAVYLGAEKFNARRGAHNFSTEGLREAVAYCHERGVKVYLTMNTVLADSELADAMALFEYACSLPVDAVIVQDLGLAHLMHEAAPQMKLSASTQMSVHTPSGVQLCKNMGFHRVVLARELSLEEIREISMSTDMELEVFVHGALCMSVSGQCYMSAMLGSRSGNRGACAQPCRLPFSAGTGTDHVLSLKDLSLVRHIHALSEAGVCSLKIEGRMKRPEYVAAAVAACVDGRDNSMPSYGFESKLEAVFSRSGFTDGYLQGRGGRDTGEMFGYRRHEDVTAATREVFQSLQALYSRESQRVGVEMVFEAVAGKPSSLEVTDGAVRVKVYGEIPQKAVNRPLDSDKARHQLSKTGGTPYFIKNITLNIDDDVAVGAAALNALRRSAIEKLAEGRRTRPAVQYSQAGFDTAPYRCKSAPALRAVFQNADSLPLSAKAFELVFVPIATGTGKLGLLLEEGFPLGVALPRVYFGREAALRSLLKGAAEAGVRHALVQNVGQIIPSIEAGMTVHGGFGLNIMNTAALETAYRLGISDCELSIEAPLKDIAKLGGKIKRGITAYGHLPFMLTRNCPVMLKEGGCAACGKKGAVTDRKGNRFPVLCGNGASEILNPIALYMFDRIRDIKNIDFLMLRFTVENSVEIAEIIEASKRHCNPLKEYTRGLFYRGVE